MSNKPIGNRKPKRSKLSAPALVGQKVDESGGLRVGRTQIADANEVAREIGGCGEPFQANGKFVGTRAQKKRYMQGINRKREDLGEPRLVNFDGGHGDET